MHLATLVLSTIIAMAGAVAPSPRPSPRSQEVRPMTRGIPSVRPIFAHSSGQLFRIDLTTQTPQVISIGSFGAQLTDLALTDDGQLYGVGFDTLYLVDPQQGFARPIGPLGPTDVNGLAAVGNRLVAGSTSGGFYYVDRVTGRATRAGSFGQGIVSSGDLCVGPGGVLYLTSPVGSRIGGQDQLLRVDPVTGAATPVGSTGLPSVFGLVYTGGERNELLGFTEGGVIARIDPHTGAAAQMALTGVPFWGGT
jgi:hypothetical protein